AKTRRKRLGLTLVRDLLQDPRPLVWLREPYLLPESIGFLIGQTGAGKSLIALAWGCEIATDELRERRGVVILAGEGHFGMARRLMALQIETGVSLKDAPIAVSQAGASLTDDDGLADVINAIDGFAETHSAPVLIIIDTLHRNFGAADENSAQDMGAFVANLDVLKTKYQAAILTVHHSGHMDATRGRGSSAIRAAADTEFLVKRSGGLLSLECSKMKDAPTPAPVALEIKQVTLPWLGASGEPETSVVVVPGEASPRSRKENMPPGVRYAIESLHAASGQHGANVAEWRPVFYAGHTGDSTGGKNKAFSRARKDLVDGGAATVENDVYRLTDGANARWGDAHGYIQGLRLKLHFAVEPQAEAQDRDTGQLPDINATCRGHGGGVTETDKTTPFRGVVSCLDPVPADGSQGVGASGEQGPHPTAPKSCPSVSEVT
ncbi:MAG: AAA family ATPase, partial [Gammaproteobacteria bacterium]|nr:AAA family ATPase [Gammaproteobacteria bacterium]